MMKKPTTRTDSFTGLVSALALLAVAGCGVEAPADDPAGQTSLVTTSEAGNNVAAPADDDTTDAPATLETLIIAPYQQSCEGYWVGMCYVVRNTADEDWRYLYEDIQGFEFESGYQYEISVAVVDNFPEPGESVPMDYYLTEYHFINEITKTPANPPL